MAGLTLLAYDIDRPWSESDNTKAITAACSGKGLL